MHGSAADFQETTPAVLGKYKLMERIGRGAMGQVFRAHDQVLDRVVAVKTISPQRGHTSHAEVVARFRHEAQAAAGLNHPNIVTVYDFGEAEGTLFMAMELLDGHDFGDAARMVPEALGPKLALVQQICDGVAFAHQRGLIHRDLKPANIHVLPGNRVKILDFGLARSLHSELTAVGNVLGTPHYMSPEQVRGERVDARSDVFALGVILYEFLTGRRPFPADTIHAVLFQVLQREPETLRTIDPSIPPVLDGLVRKAMAKEASERFQSAGEMADALSSVRGFLSGERLEPEMLRPKEPEPVLSASANTGSATRLGPCALTFRGESGGDRLVNVPDGSETLLASSLAAGIPHFHECGGRARCSTCRVRVITGGANLTPRTAEEARMATRLGWDKDIRLACQAKPAGDVVVQRLIFDTDDVGLLLRERNHGGEREVALAILSCDISGFQDLAKRLTPYDLMHVLNRFYGQMCDPVLTNGGVIRSYTAHGLLGLFGTRGGDAREKCLNAVRAALRMRARMQDFNRYMRDHFSSEFRIAIGLHYGRVVLGAIGHPSSTQLTTIGEAPSICEKVGALNDRNGTEILGTEEILNVIEDQVQAGHVFHDEEGIGNRRISVYEIADFRKRDTVSIVQESFEKVARRADEAAGVFYDLLFQVAPETKSLFSNTDMPRQREMLMSVLSAAIRGLDRFDELRPVLVALGQRHTSYGVETHHSDAVEQALLEMLRRSIGDDFTLDVRLAWTKIYGELCAVMLGSATGSPIDTHPLGN